LGVFASPKQLLYFSKSVPLHFLASDVDACADDGKSGSVTVFFSSLDFATTDLLSSLAFSLAFFLSSLAFSAKAFLSSLAFSLALCSAFSLSSLDFFLSSLGFSATGILSSLGFVTVDVSSLDLATSLAGTIFPRCRLPSLNSPTNLSRFGYIKVPFPLGLSSLNCPTYFSPSGQVRVP